MFLLSVLLFYHGLIGSGDISTTTLRDYVVVHSLVEGMNPQEMVKIVNCESQFRQFDDKGKPLRSPTSDVGIAQINQVHWKRAKDLGLDIFHSPVDNMKMATIIYREQGLKAWTCYKPVPKNM